MSARICDTACILLFFRCAITYYYSDEDRLGRRIYMWEWEHVDPICQTPYLPLTSQVLYATHVILSRSNDSQLQLKLRGKRSRRKAGKATMDAFPFREDDHHDIHSWAFSPLADTLDFLEYLRSPLVLSTPAVPPPQSAFVRYKACDGAAMSAGSGSMGGGASNIHRRMIRFWQTVVMGVRMESCKEKTAGNSRELRHLMKERRRRERLSQGFADLRFMLSHGSKVSILFQIQ